MGMMHFNPAMSGIGQTTCGKSLTRSNWHTGANWVTCKACRALIDNPSPAFGGQAKANSQRQGGAA